MPAELNSFSRRDLLSLIGRAAGGAAMYQAMDSLGFAEESPYNGPVHLEGGARGASVLVLGAGIAGMVAAYELRSGFADGAAVHAGRWQCRSRGTRQPVHDHRRAIPILFDLPGLSHVGCQGSSRRRHVSGLGAQSEVGIRHLSGVRAVERTAWDAELCQRSGRCADRVSRELCGNSLWQQSEVVDHGRGRQGAPLGVT